MICIPKKLKKDAIVEAICEIKFESSEMPEVVIGTISSQPFFKQYTKRRLPIADIPTPIRLSDPSLKFQPLLDLASLDEKERVKIGGNSISLHMSFPYPGWDIFSKRIAFYFSSLFSVLDGFIVTRVGLRYLNALTTVDHFVSSLDDLKIHIRVADSKISPEFNFNFKKKKGADYNAMIRVASMDFVSGKVPKNAAAFIDIDVFTSDEFIAKNFETIQLWLGEAHDFEKENFFELLGGETVDKIKEG